MSHRFRFAVVATAHDSGHEGAGVVLACGPGVTHVQPGDRVLLNWAIPCGDCFQCRKGAENTCEQQPIVPNERFQCGKDFLSTSFRLGPRPFDVEHGRRRAGPAGIRWYSAISNSRTRVTAVKGTRVTVTG